MALSVLSVAFPFAPVRPDTAGGAEQIVLTLDRALIEAGHRSVVIACAGSDVTGALVCVPRPSGLIDDETRRRAQHAHARAIGDALRGYPVDVVHMHGLDFHAYLPPAGIPVLVTLHLPLDLYPPQALCPSRPQTFLHCVSPAQHATRPDGADFLPWIENGIPAKAAGVRAEQKFALCLGRICPEKGVHLAMDAAKRANIPLVIAGTVFPYKDHIRYFNDEIRPRLDCDRRFVGSVGAAVRDQLLSQACCLLLPSLVEETSSLVAREALASGTPVIAYPRHALVELMEHGRNGFLVDDVEQMADCIAAVDSIDREACRNSASRFPVARMVDSYFALYRRLARTPAAMTC